MVPAGAIIEKRQKLYWTYFGLDPMPSWWFSFAATAREIGLEDGRRWFSFNDPSHLEKRTKRSADAATWLDALVKLRHATAHQDATKYRQPPVIGVATPGRGSRQASRAFDLAAGWEVPAHVSVPYPFVPPTAIDDARAVAYAGSWMSSSHGMIVP